MPEGPTLVVRASKCVGVPVMQGLKVIPPPPYKTNAKVSARMLSGATGTYDMLTRACYSIAMRSDMGLLPNKFVMGDEHGVIAQDAIHILFVQVLSHRHMPVNCPSEDLSSFRMHRGDLGGSQAECPARCPHLRVGGAHSVEVQLAKARCASIAGQGRKACNRCSTGRQMSICTSRPAASATIMYYC